MGEIVGILGTLMGLVDKTLDLLPDYDQKQKRKWMKLKKEYLIQVNRDLEFRDADLILNLKDSILLFADNIVNKGEDKVQ